MVSKSTLMKLGLRRRYAVRVKLRPHPRVNRPGIPFRSPVIDFGKLLSGQGRFDRNSLRLLQVNPESGDPLIQDDQLEGMERFLVPHRYEPSFEGESVSPRHDIGRLVWVVRNVQASQDFVVLFDTLESGRASPPRLPALIGDNDFLCQPQGLLNTGTFAKPSLLCDGRRLYCSHKYAVWCFERDNTDDEIWVSRGEVRTKDGLPLNYHLPEPDRVNSFAMFVDFRGVGVHDIICCCRQGDLFHFTNEGDDEHPIYVPAGALRYGDGERINVYGDTSFRAVPPSPLNGYHTEMAVKAFQCWTTVRVVDFDGSGGRDLLTHVSLKGLYLLRNCDCLERPIHVTDVNGEPIGNKWRLSSFLWTDWDGDGRPDLILTAMNQDVYFYRNVGTREKPEFQNQGSIIIRGYKDGSPCSLYRQPALGMGDVDSDGDDEVLLTTSLRHLAVCRVDRSKNPRDLVFERFLRQRYAPITGIHCKVRIADFDGDGRPDMIYGDETGAIFYYRNIGSRNNPVCGPVHRVRDRDGPVLIDGGVDSPATTFEQSRHGQGGGYPQLAIVDWENTGEFNLIAGTDWGHFLYYRYLGLDDDGVPRYAQPVYLKDSEGRPIIHMIRSHPELADLDGDGRLDMISYGTTRPLYIHTPLDPDQETRLRFHRNTGFDEHGVPIFAPYVAWVPGLSGEETAHVGVPNICDWDEDGRMDLLCRHHFYRSEGTREAPRLAYKEEIWEEALFVENQLPARALSALGMTMTHPSVVDFGGVGNDGVICGSELSVITFLRKSFLLNRGYLDADFEIGALELLNR